MNYIRQQTKLMINKLVQYGLALLLCSSINIKIKQMMYLMKVKIHEKYTCIC